MTSSTPNPTDEAVEAAALALFGYDEFHWETSISDDARDEYRRDARDALAAGLPALRARIETELRQQIAGEIEAFAAETRDCGLIFTARDALHVVRNAPSVVTSSAAATPTMGETA